MIDKIDNALKRKNLNVYLTRANLNYFVLFLAMIVAIYADWNLKQIGVGFFALWILLYPMKSTSAAKLSLIFLALIPVAIIMGRDSKAENLAIITYAFLVLTAILSFLDSRKQK